LLGGQTETNDKEGGHEEACIGLLVELGAAMMEDLDSLVLLIFEDAVEFQAISVQLCKVERPEILVIPLINKHIVHIEEEAFGDIFRRVRIAIPIQTV